MAFRIIRDDITRVKADAIVNTANPKPVIGGGTDTAVYEAAGKEQLLAARKVIGNIDPGDAVETPAFNLKAKYIIHTVGPIWNGGKSNEFDILKNAYKNSMELAKRLNCKSIAFPLMATGSNGFPKDKALQIALSTIQEFLIDNEMKVILVVFDQKAFVLSGKLTNKIKAYIDENYVGQANEREYKYRNRLFATARYQEIEEEYKDAVCFSQEEPVKLASIAIEPIDKTFQEKLFEIIDARGIQGPDVYKNYVSKQVYSKLQSDKNYQPSKTTALALCLSLHLSVEKTEELLKSAGYVLSPSSLSDMIIKACIINKEYDLIQIDLYLFENGCQPFNKG